MMLANEVSFRVQSKFHCRQRKTCTPDTESGRGSWGDVAGDKECKNFRNGVPLMHLLRAERVKRFSGV